MEVSRAMVYNSLKNFSLTVLKTLDFASLDFIVITFISFGHIANNLQNANGLTPQSFISCSCKIWWNLSFILLCGRTGFNLFIELLS